MGTFQIVHQIGSIFSFRSLLSKSSYSIVRFYVCDDICKACSLDASSSRAHVMHVHVGPYRTQGGHCREMMPCIRAQSGAIISVYLHTCGRWKALTNEARATHYRWPGGKHLVLSKVTQTQFGRAGHVLLLMARMYQKRKKVYTESVSRTTAVYL